MGEYDKSEILKTWNELQTLQKETESLLATISGPKKAKKNVGAVTKQLQAIKKATKLDKKTSFLSSSLDSFTKTEKLYAANTPGRVTVEVFDDAPQDFSPRQDYNNTTMTLSSSPNDLKSRLFTAEQKIQKLNFTDEKSRVNSRDDVFIPAPGVTLTQVEHERKRLAALEETARMQQVIQVLKKEARQEYLAQDKAALKFQAIFRGHIGRQRMSLTRRLTELDVDQPVGEWMEIKDRESGDIWYYNTQTGKSQWDKPIKMFDTMPKGKTLKPISTPVTDKRAASQSLLKTNKAVSFRSEAELQQIEEDTKAIKDCNEILGLQDLTPVENLSVPDGSFKPQLRKTILDAILTTRFDSVSTVLADDRWMEGETAPFADKKQANLFEPAIKVDKSRPALCVPLTIHKKKKNIAKLTSNPAADDREAALPEVNKNALTVSQISQPGFNSLDSEEPSTMCFGCWSAGVRRNCQMHTDPNSNLPPSQTMLLCRNWDLNVMRRRYRSEEIQEIFLKKTTSMRFDSKRKKLYTVKEHRHMVYRALYKLLDELNFKMLMVTKGRRWLQSLLDTVRSGQVKPAAGKEAARIMRKKRTIQKGGQVKRYLRTIYRRLPIPPTTGYSLEEREGSIQFLFKHRDPTAGREVELIKAFPTPKSVKLYTARVQHLPIPRAIPMPYPDYSSAASAIIIGTTKYLPSNNRAVWLEEMSAAFARDTAASAILQTTAVMPLPGLELIRRTKYPPPNSIKFATIGRKPTPGLLAVGGLAAELLVYQLVSTYIPAQYGSLMVMDKSTVSPGITPEVTIVFVSLQQPPVPQIYIERPLEHPMNYRRAPSISVCSLVDIFEKYYYGRNRPDQTGEQDPHGFRTTTWARYLETHMDTDPTVFTPSSEVASLNSLSANRSKCTHVDLTYPFCEPTTKDNSSLEFYHLLLTGEFSSSKTQVFTALTVQEPGEFLRNAREDCELGHMLVNVYRSWSFTQKDTIEEFMSDDGHPYWYHRRTGQTFWERPYHDEEKVLPLKGGTVLDLEHPEEPSLVSKSQEGAERRYTQGEFRKLMLLKHEMEDQAATRRQRAAAGILVSKGRGVFPVLNESTYAQGSDSIFDGSTGGPPRDAMSMATAGGANSLQLQPQGSTHAASQQVGEITQSMSQYDSQIHSPSHGQSVRSPSRSGAGDNSRGGGVPVRGSALDRDDASQIIGEGSQAFFPGSPSAVMPLNFGIADESGAIPNMMAGLDTNIMAQLSMSIGHMLSNMSLDHTNPQDMIKMGVGMGMAMMNSNIGSQMLNPDSAGSVTSSDHLNKPAVVGRSKYDSSEVVSNSQFFPQVAESDFVNGKPANRVLVHDPNDRPKHPIGIPDFRVQNVSSDRLNHNEETTQRHASAMRGSVPLSAIERAMEVKIVQPTETPDEAPSKALTVELPKNADEALKLDIPLLIYPELSTQLAGGAPGNTTTHAAAGIGTAHVVADNGTEQLYVKGTGEANIRRAVMPLPVGFFGAIKQRHVGKQLVDYLPQVPNIPMARTVGRVKPRSTAVDWIAIGFDPWSAGRSPLNAEFISSLATKADKLFKGDTAKGNAEEVLDDMRKQTIKDAFITVEDSEGLLKNKVEVSKTQIMVEDFKKLCSLARHTKFADAEAMLSQPDWTVPIDYQDETGNTFLHIACQNGSKRLVKLCLRRGASLSTQNLNGQTCLHFAFGYGYNDLGDYLISKGADNSVMNKDGLTCYEGLGARELSLL